ncbi:MAG TPA: CHRD domain-containing protein [Bauldia sp.]|nr:CHRD domain-containing protein [Bauldia sp.]
MVRGVKLAALAWLAAAVLVPAAANADLLSFRVHLTGAAEVPPVTTDAKGSAIAGYDSATKEFTWVINYSGLSGPVTAAEFHGPAAKDATAPLMFAISGDLASPLKGSAKLTDDQAKALADGLLYINLMTAAHPDGEIRSQVIPST